MRTLDLRVEGSSPSRPISKLTPALLLVLLAFAIAACGDDDDKATDRATSNPTQTEADGTRPGAGTRTGGERARGEEGGGPGGTGAAEGGGSGGTRAPSVERPVRKRSLQRYLARRYRLTEWYGQIRKITTRGGHVRVYMTLDVESDDEGPPVLACNAVNAYARGVKKVTVYGRSRAAVPTHVLKEC